MKSKENQSKRIEGATEASGVSSSQQYFKRLRKYPLLSRDEEIELAIQIRNGNTRAFKRLVSSNLRLVIQIARRFQGRGLELEDLIQEGNLGLIRAAELFDPDRGIRFSTYATRWIIQKLSRACDNHSRVIRIPVGLHQAIRAVLRARNDYMMKHGLEPEPEELVQATGLPLHRIELALDYMQKTLSLNQDKYGDESSELLDDVPSDFMEVEKVVDRQLEATYLAKLLKELSPLEQAVTVYRYGLFDNPQKSYEQLSAGLDLPKQSLRNAFKRALAKLRKRAKLESQREIGNGFGSSLLLRG